jgi:prevent-host-death family protein
MSVADVRNELESLVDRILPGETRVVIEKDGRPVAVLVSPQDLKRMVQLETEWEQDFAVFDEIGAAFAGVPAEEIERETAKTLAEVRAERRAERTAGAAR